MKFILGFYFRYALLLPLIFILGCGGKNQRTISGDISNAKVDFAVEEIKQALSQNEIEVSKIEISFQVVPDGLIEREGFQISTEGNTKIIVRASDPAGAMYGGLELAEQIRLYGWEGVTATQQNPHMEMRGVKFNIPLDARTPSYSDASDAGQNNIETVWDFEFWKRYIDNLAKHRYNYISLWSLHPFPSLVKVPSYPDIALDDVWKSTAKWNENYDLNGPGLDDSLLLSNPAIIKSISIDQKIEFWRKVMAYGKIRNIDFHIITWNIFTNGINGKYGITDDSKNEVTRDYFKESIKQLFITYPDLQGIGLATGENMRGLTTEEKEDWAFESYAKGLLEAAKEMPDRQFTFIHRQHQTGAKDILTRFSELTEQPNIDFTFCFKYAKAHVYSAVEQPFHHEYVNDIQGQETLWGLRNDDIYYFRWGAPDFVRSFIQHIPTGDITKGIYYGSDQWIWGKDFLSRNTPGDSTQLEIEKHWYQWMLWGRLSYDPSITNERFTAILKHRYPAADATLLFTAWQQASMTYPITTGFHWGALDFQWYIEGCRSRPAQANNETGFHDVNRFITLLTHPMSGYQSIPDFIKEGKQSDLLTPFEVSDLLHQKMDSAMALVSKIKKDQSELDVVIDDIQTISYLGKYYAFKIAGSTYTALFRQTKDAKYRVQAMDELTQALTYWKKYTALASVRNKNPLWTNRVGYVDWNKTTEWVAHDIILCQQ